MNYNHFQDEFKKIKVKCKKKYFKNIKKLGPIHIVH